MCMFSLELKFRTRLVFSFFPAESLKEAVHLNDISFILFVIEIFQDNKMHTFTE